MGTKIFEIDEKMSEIIDAKVGNPQNSTSKIWANFSQPWNLAFFQDYIFKKYVHFQSQRVPKWKIAHIWQPKSQKNNKITPKNVSQKGLQSLPDVLQHPVYIYILPVLCVPLIDFITLHKVKCSSCIHSQMAVSLSQLGCLTIQRWAKKGHKFYVQSLTYIEKIQADFLDFHMGPTNLQIKISLGRNKIVFLALVELPLPLYCY